MIRVNDRLSLDEREIEETFIRAGLLGGLARDDTRNESRKSRG